MSATEHQKKEWVAAIKRDFPRLAGQEELLKMMVDVYSENPGFLQKLSRKLENEKGKAKGTELFTPDARFAAGELVGAVEIISKAEVKEDAESESDTERALSASKEGGGGTGEVADPVPTLDAV